MNNKEFDELLKNSVTEHDRANKTVFNSERVWNATRRKNRTLTYVTVAASLLLAISVLMIDVSEPVTPVVVAKRPAVSGQGVISSPEAVPDQAEQSVNAVIPETSYPVKEKEGAEALPETDDISPVLSEPAAPMIAVTETVPVASPEEPVTAPIAGGIKVSFRRGGAVKPDPEGPKLAQPVFKLRIFKDQPYDSSSYVSSAEIRAERRFKIKF